MYEKVCEAHEITINQMKQIVEIFNSDIKEIRFTNQDMRNYIDSCRRYPERRAAYPGQSTAHFENVANITDDGDSVITQEKEWQCENHQANTYNKNEANKSIEKIARKTIEKCEQNNAKTRAKQLNKTRANKLNKTRVKQLI